MQWDTQLLEYVEELHKTYTWAEIAEALSEDMGIDITANAARKALYRKRFRNEDMEELDVPASVEPLFSPMLSIPYADTLVLYDCHAPYHNQEFIRTAVSLARVAGATQCITDFDLFDFEVLSDHTKTGDVLPLSKELRVAGSLIQYLTHHFDLYMFDGNHGRRMTRRLKEPIEMRQVIYAALEGREVRNRIITTEREMLTMDTNWLFAHPTTMSSKIPGKVPSDLAVKYQRNVLSGHTHKRGYMSAGAFIGLEVGCSLSSNAIWYKEHGANNYVPFELGFALIIGGRLYHFDELGNTSLNGTKQDFSWWNSYFRENI